MKLQFKKEQTRKITKVTNIKWLPGSKNLALFETKFQQILYIYGIDAAKNEISRYKIEQVSLKYDTKIIFMR